MVTGQGGTPVPGVVKASHIADNAVTAEKIADPISILTEYELEVIPAQNSVAILGVPPGWVKYAHHVPGDEISAGSKGYKYICTVEGSSAGSPPDWPDVIGATVKGQASSTVWWECAAGNALVYSDVIDVRNAKSILLTIINHSEVHNLKAIILRSYDGVHFDSPDVSEAVVTVDKGEEQKSCMLTPGMAYLKVGLLKAYEDNTTASSIVTIRK